jgi:hypothetical protein
LWPFLGVLVAPAVPTVAALDRGVGIAAIFAAQVVCILLLIEGDEGLASWRGWDVIGRRLRPLIDRARDQWRGDPVFASGLAGGADRGDRLFSRIDGRCRPWRPRVCRAHKRWTLPVWGLALGIPLLGVLQSWGLVSGYPEPFGGVGLTSTGLSLAWLIGCVLAMAWWLLLPLRFSQGAELDTPEMRPVDRVSDIATLVPSGWFFALRIIHFVGLPLLAHVVTP